MASTLRSGKKRKPETDSDTEDEGKYTFQFWTAQWTVEFKHFLTLSLFIALFSLDCTNYFLRPRPCARSPIIDSDSDNDFQEFQARPSTSKVQRADDTLATEEESSGDESSGDESSGNKIEQGTILLIYTLG